jgi:xanthine dehydrogenase/oxidase
VINACEQLNQRLVQYRERFPSFKQAVNAAYYDCINLTAQGHYATPELGFNFETNVGTPFNYFSYGVGCSEVEVDVLTGDHHIIRSDILMDVGISLNPAIDIGQIEGAFAQGVGLHTIEEVVWQRNGNLLTRGPGAYKIPSFNDTPTDFRITLLENSKNPVCHAHAHAHCRSVCVLCVLA